MLFLHLDALTWAWIVIVAALVLGAGIGARNRVWRKLATSGMRDRLRASGGPARHGIRAVMLVSALALLVVALMDPRWGSSFEPVSQRNIDVMFVLDSSRSMRAEDLAPNRLDRARQYIDDVIRHAAGDRVGLVSFAGQAHLEVPLTRDTTSLRLALERVRIRGGRAGGSMLGDAIRLAADSFGDDDTIEGSKAIIVLSDGEDMGSWPVEAAASAHERGVQIWTVGLGDAQTGARIPMDVDGESIFLTHDGAEVWSKMDPLALEQVALAAGGAFLPAGTSNLDLADVYAKVIAPGSGRRIDSGMVERPTPRYRWFLLPALFLLVLEWLYGRFWTRPMSYQEAIA
jgi:Ca-activated chloride channel family protein